MRKSERKVGQFVLAQPDEVIRMRIVDLAEQAEVSEPTVVRFCRAVGCNGFQDFKLAVGILHRPPRTGTRCTILWMLSQAKNQSAGELLATAAKAGYSLEQVRGRLEILQAQ